MMLQISIWTESRLFLSRVILISSGYNGFRGAPFYWTMRRLSIMVGWKSITINYGRRYAQSSTKVNSP
jgi:hypothetical protein